MEGKNINKFVDLITSLFEGGGLIQTGGAYLWGGESLFNYEKTMVSVLNTEIEYKVEKLKYKKLEVMQPRIKNKSELPISE